MNKDGTLNKNVPKNYQNLDRFEAREKLIKELNDLEQIEKIEDINNTVPFGDRSGVVVEPLLTKQWFVDAKNSKNAIVKVKIKKQFFIQKIGARPIFNGWKILSHGVSPDNYGGDTKYRHGIQK